MFACMHSCSTTPASTVQPSVHRVFLSSCTKSAATGCLDGNVRLWSLTTFRCTHTLAHGSDRVTSLRLLGPVVVSGGRDTQVKVWTLAGEGECIGTCDHGAPVLGVEVTPLGLVASVGYGGLKPRVWRMKNVNEIISGREVPRGPALALARQASSTASAGTADRVAANSTAAPPGVARRATWSAAPTAVGAAKAAAAFRSSLQRAASTSGTDGAAATAQGAGVRRASLAATLTAAAKAGPPNASPRSTSSGVSPSSVIKAPTRVGPSKFAMAAASVKAAAAGTQPAAPPAAPPTAPAGRRFGIAAASAKLAAAKTSVR